MAPCTNARTCILVIMNDSSLGVRRITEISNCIFVLGPIEPNWNLNPLIYIYSDSIFNQSGTFFSSKLILSIVYLDCFLQVVVTGSLWGFVNMLQT